jgi:hypothetical protein
MRVSFSSVVAAGAGILIAGIALTFLDSTLPRIIVGGAISVTTPAVFLFLTRADFRRWIIG